LSSSCINLSGFEEGEAGDGGDGGGGGKGERERSRITRSFELTMIALESIDRRVCERRVGNGEREREICEELTLPSD